MKVLANVSCRVVGIEKKRIKDFIAKLVKCSIFSHQCSTLKDILHESSFVNDMII